MKQLQAELKKKNAEIKKVGSAHADASAACEKKEKAIIASLNELDKVRRDREKDQLEFNQKFSVFEEKLRPFENDRAKLTQRETEIKEKIRRAIDKKIFHRRILLEQEKKLLAQEHKQLEVANKRLEEAKDQLGSYLLNASRPRREITEEDAEELWERACFLNFYLDEQRQVKEFWVYFF